VALERHRLMEVSLPLRFLAMGLTLRRGERRCVVMVRVEDSATMVPTAIDSE
jgi:hypothetical protein